MRTILAALAVIAVSGCANVNGVMTPTMLGAYFDAQDPCQREPMPSFCGKGSKSFATVNGTVYVIE